MIDIGISKYEKNVINNLNKENTMNKISYLLSNNCDYIEELLEDYLDIFSFEYSEFVSKFNILNKKYNYNLINEIKEDMNILEELYY